MLIEIIVLLLSVCALIEYFGNKSMSKHVYMPTSKTANAKRRTKPAPEFPAAIPYRSPLLTTLKTVGKVVTGQSGSLRDMELMNSNVRQFERETGAMISSAFFMGRKAILSWDADTARQLMTDEEHFGKLKGFVEAFDEVSEQSILMVEGEQWRDQKAVMSPAFGHEHLKGVVPHFNVVGERLVSLWKAIAERDDAVEVTPYMSKATVDALGLGGFGYDFDALGVHGDKAKAQLNNSRTFMSGLVNPFLTFRAYKWLCRSRYDEFVRSRDDYMDFLMQVVDEKKRAREQDDDADRPKDLLDLMIEAHSHGASSSRGRSAHDNRSDMQDSNSDDSGDDDEHYEVTRSLTDAELRANLNIFFIAGHATTSSTVAFALHLLEQNADVQAKVYAEIMDVIGPDAEVTHEHLCALSYMKLFLKETMRLYPAAGALGRGCIKDTEFGGYKVFKGDFVMQVVYTTQRHERYFPDEPDKCKPERWLNKQVHPYAYIPWSIGKRSCIGRVFSELEQRALLVAILRNFELMPDRQAKVPFGTITDVVLSVAEGHTLRLQSRKAMTF
jgi:cytochrome P450 family 9